MKKRQKKRNFSVFYETGMADVRSNEKNSSSKKIGRYRDKSDGDEDEEDDEDNNRPWIDSMEIFCFGNLA